LTANELWLRTLQAICDSAAHEVKGAMNGVAVNLEVVRTRAQRDGPLSQDVRSYATSAADQLGALNAMTQAMLSLVRTGREPADVGRIAGQIVSLLGPGVRSGGNRLEFIAEPLGKTTTSAPVAVVRLVLGAALYAMAEHGGGVCRVGDGVSPTVFLSPPPDTTELEDVLPGCREAGIVVATDGGALSIRFPAADIQSRNAMDVP